MRTKSSLGAMGISMAIGLHLAPSPAQALNIVCVGTSITAGAGKWQPTGTQVGEYCYRYWLWNDLAAWKASGSFPEAINFVGTQYKYWSGTTQHSGLWDVDHEGYAGASISGINTGLKAAITTLSQAQNKPDIALVEGGTNDIINAVTATPSTTIQASDVTRDFNSLIATLRSINPNIIILLAKTIPPDQNCHANTGNCKTGPGGNYDQTLNILNPTVASVASANTTPQSPVVIVDQFTNFDRAWLMDNFHPDENGAKFMKDRWFKAIMRVLPAKSFNGDNKDDLHFVQYGGMGNYVNLSTGSAFAFQSPLLWASSFGIFRPDGYGGNLGKYFTGDFNGDKVMDVAYFDPNTVGHEDFYVDLSTGSAFQGAGTKWIPSGGFGNAGGTYLVGDFNGDGKDDLFFFQPNPNTGGTGYVALSTGSSFDAAHAITWIPTGTFGNMNSPLARWFAADFNGDGYCDIGFYQNGGATFNVLLTKPDGTGASFPGSAWATSLVGDNGDYAVGDFDGDGMADVFYLPASNLSGWVNLSTGSSLNKTGSGQWFGPSAFGGMDGKHFAADWNGDGKCDLGFFQPGGNTFYTNFSNGTSFYYPPNQPWVQSNYFGSSSGVYQTSYRKRIVVK